MICICPNCGTTAAPRTYTRGSIFIEIILWICFIVPGVIYSIWRLTTRQRVCPVCRQPGVVPIGSPRGIELAQALAPRAEPEKTCPRYAERVKAAAMVCRFCGHEFEACPVAPPASARDAAATSSASEVNYWTLAKNVFTKRPPWL